ncbi:hypothetical protein [Treponema pedis]|uniref:hypothetical protein n=1 Tax=Treponema pedis TaxID=409322 RepID=UPI00197F4A96|nr:hypothetical protein [Treponema pedis]QSI05609.1 hypothetical protein DYQ05_12180 [Treponema pedis]
MKKYRYIIFAVFAMNLVSCKPSIFSSLFSKIKIKAGPEFNVNAGTLDVRLSSYLSAKKIIEDISKDEKFAKSKIFEYPGYQGEGSAFLIRYPITGLDLDMSKNFNAVKEAEKEISVALEEKSFTFKNPPKYSQEIDLGILPNINIPVSGEFNHEVDIKEIVVPVNIGVFEKAKISDGELTFKIDVPSGGQGLTFDYSKIKITQDGEGLEITLNSEGKADLKEKIINKNKVKVAGKIEIKSDNSTPVQNATSNFEIKIKKFEYVEVKMPDNFSPKVTKKTPVSDDLKKWVKNVHFKELSTSITVKNNLPEGNDIKIAVSSEAFGINKDSTNEATFKSGSSETKTIKRENFDFSPKDKTDIDFTVDMTVGDYSESSKTLKIKNVEAGKQVSFGGKIKVTPDWEFVVINPNENGIFKGSYPKAQSDNINLGGFEEFQKKGIRLNNVKGYVYISSDILSNKNTDLNGKVSLDYLNKETNNQEQTYLLGSEGTEEKVKFVPPLPDFFYNANNGSVYSGSLPEASKEADLSEPFGKDSTNFKFNYELKLNEIKIYKTDIKGNDGKTSKISGDLLLVIPLSFNTAKDIVLGKVDGSGDFFKRPDSGNGLIDKATKAVKEVVLKLDYYNGSGISLDAVLTGKNGKFKKNVQLKPGKGLVSVEITEEDIADINKTYPFVVDMEVVAPKGSHAVSLEKPVTVSPSVSVKLDINETVNVNLK